MAAKPCFNRGRTGVAMEIDIVGFAGYEADSPQSVHGL
jgi:hypothetical protein